MKSWVKRNPELALGLGLPFLLVFFFMLATYIPKLFIEPPKYDVLFLSSNYHAPQEGMRVDSQNQRASFVYSGNYNGYNWPKLYRFYAATGNVRELSMPVPQELPIVDGSHPSLPQDRRSVVVTVPEMDALRVDSSILSPDGYQFYADIHNHSPDVLGLLTVNSRNTSSAAIAKSGNVVRIPRDTDNNYYAYVTFVGWIIP